jgi:PTS system mannitol-specific IIC component
MLTNLEHDAEAEEEHDAASHRKPIHNIVFACDAGMGSSAMGASILRNKVKKAGFDDVKVVNVAIANLTDDIDLVVTNQDLTPRAKDRTPSAQHVSVDNFMSSPKYDAIVEELKRTNLTTAAHRAEPEPKQAGDTPVRPRLLFVPDRSQPLEGVAGMSDVLSLSQVKVPGTARSKDDAIREAGGIPVDAGAVTPDYIDAMFEREKSVSTYMGNYLAIPHGTNESQETIKRSALSVIRYDPPIDWDGNEVRFAMGIAGYEGGHMDILSRVAILFSDTDEVDKLLAAQSAEELFELLNAVNED